MKPTNPAPPVGTGNVEQQLNAMAKKIAAAKNSRFRTRTHRPWSSPPLLG